MPDRSALVLEDEALIALDVSDALIATGYFTTILVSSAEAAAWLDVNPPPDVVVIDVKLQDGPSHKVAKRIASLGIPMVVHSGRPGPTFPEDEVFAKATWINKPSYADDLVGAVERAVAQRDGPRVSLRP